jgi:microcystin-dependent protein
VPHSLRQRIRATAGRAVLLSIVAGASPALAGVPTQFSLQGSLRDGAGKLQSTVVPASMSLFDSMSGDNRIAGPYSFPMVAVQNGLFTLTVDDPALLTKLGKGGVFVELTIGGDVYSRFSVTSQIFALRAATCDSADQLRAFPLAPAPPSEGQVLRFTAGAWTPTTVAAGGGGPGPSGPPGPPGPAGDIPSGAVLAFDLDRCPAGWAPFSPAAGRTIIGVNDGANGLSPLALGATVGEESHVLTADEIAPHTHAGSTGPGKAMKYRTVGVPGTNSRGDHVAGWAGTSAFLDREDAGWALAAHGHDFVTDTGSVGGKAHNNMQPSLALLYCKKL